MSGGVADIKQPSAQCQPEQGIRISHFQYNLCVFKDFYFSRSAVDVILLLPCGFIYTLSKGTLTVACAV